MTICCRIDDRQIHRRLRQHVGLHLKWAHGQTAHDLRAESKELPGRFLETSRGWGPIKLCKTVQSRELPSFSLGSRLVFL